MAEYALEQLRESIILGELTAGTPLRLDELAQPLGMSISPIREAVRQLEALGLAKHVPHQGARVMVFDVEELRDLFDPPRARVARRAAGGRALRAGRGGGGASAPRVVRRGAAPGRYARRDARAHGVPLHGVRRRPLGMAAAPDPAVLGQLRALPARAARREGRRGRTATRSSTASCWLRAQRTIPTARRPRCASTSSSRATSTRSSSPAAGSSRSSQRCARRRTAASARSGSEGRKSLCATSVPEPAPRPGPGYVLAPMWQRPSIAVAWPRLRRKRAPEEVLVERRAHPRTDRRGGGSTFAASRSAGESTTRPPRRRLEVRDVRAPAAPGCGRRSARGGTRSTFRPPCRARRPRLPSPARGAPAAGSTGCPLPSGARDGSIVERLAARRSSPPRAEARARPRSRRGRRRPALA